MNQFGFVEPISWFTLGHFRSLRHDCPLKILSRLGRGLGVIGIELAIDVIQPTGLCLVLNRGAHDLAAPDTLQAQT